jgi:benzoylformate decarboxylase
MRIRPPAEEIVAAADLLGHAKSPAILAGSRVAQRGAVSELVQVAEQLGATVYGEPLSNHGRAGFPCHHPLYAYELPLWSPDIRQRLAPHDVLLVVGMDLIRQYVYHEPAAAIPESTRVVHLDEDPREIGKNYPLAVGLCGDTQAGLIELHRQLVDAMTGSEIEAAEQRRRDGAQRQTGQRSALVEQIAQQSHARPLAPTVLMHAIARALPSDAAVIEAAVTTTGGTLERLGAIRDPYGYFGQRGWTLGWGLNVAMGVKLAWPDRPVLGIIGDGAAMYGIQGLWSAARYRIPVTWVICNNGQYRILKDGSRGLGLPNAQQGRFLGLDLNEPSIDFVSLAQSLGVKAQRVTEPDELSAELTRSLQGDEPRLLEVPIAT